MELMCVAVICVVVFVLMHIDFISSFMIFLVHADFRERKLSGAAINLYYYFSSKLCGLMCLFMILFHFIIGSWK